MPRCMESQGVGWFQSQAVAISGHNSIILWLKEVICGNMFGCCKITHHNVKITFYVNYILPKLSLVFVFLVSAYTLDCLPYFSTVFASLASFWLHAFSISEWDCHFHLNLSHKPVCLKDLLVLIYRLLIVDWSLYWRLKFLWKLINILLYTWTESQATHKLQVFPLNWYISSL